MKTKQVRSWLKPLLLALLSFSVGCLKEPEINPPALKDPAVSPTPSKAKKELSKIIVAGNAGELTIAGIEQGRNLQLYDQGGHYDFYPLGRRGIDGPKNRRLIETNLKIVRQFVWSHWRNKKQGYIRLTTIGTDNATTEHIFIEPESHNKWIINKSVASRSVIGESVTPVEPIVEVRWGQKKNGHPALIFKDAMGKVIDKL